LFFFLASALFFSCENKRKFLAENHSCFPCQNYFKEKSSIKYDYLAYQITNKKKQIGTMIGFRDIKSVESRTNWLGHLRIVNKKDSKYLSEHKYCFIGQEFSFINDFISPHIDFTENTPGNTKIVTYTYDLGEYTNNPYKIDWLNRTNMSFNFEKRNGKYVYVGNSSDSLRLFRCY